MRANAISEKFKAIALTAFGRQGREHLSRLILSAAVLLLTVNYIHLSGRVTALRYDINQCALSQSRIMLAIAKADLSTTVARKDIIQECYQFLQILQELQELLPPDTLAPLAEVVRDTLDNQLLYLEP